ncbi:MAG: UvrD-helicase domain-containing protein [Oscillospiraceae bacterium]
MVKWTSQQLDAINAKNCSLIVSAAAGSGKTAVLVERLLRILSDKDNKISADRIVVATFSNESASEMKIRLIKAITEEIEKNPNNDWLIKQHSMLQNAKITTIHSFCFDLIRENISDLNISSNFRIIEPTEENILQSKAIQEAIEDMYSNEDTRKDMEFLSQSLCDKTDFKLEALLLDLYKFLSSVPFFDDWLQTNCIDYYSKADMQNDLALQSVFNMQIENLEEAYNLSNMVLELCNCPEEKDTNINTLTVENNNLIDAINFLKSKDKFNVDTLKYYSKFNFKRLTLSANNPNKEKAKRYRDMYKDLYNSKMNFSVLADIVEYYSQDKATNKNISQTLKDLISCIYNKLLEIKIEENVLGFSDAEQIAIKLLAKKNEKGEFVQTELAKNLSKYYEIIMIDEFQDTNNNQDLIFKMISKGGTNKKIGHNMFVVGDVKQSIYNFRLANPVNFKKVLEYSKPYIEENPSINSKIKLNQNFRSSKDVIDFVNLIFENIMKSETGEVDYKDEKLILGANYPEYDRRTEIPIIDSNKYSEPDYIARKIKSMLNNGTLVTEKDGSTRPCKPSDFCLLFMATTDVVSYFEKLQELNIPVNFEKDEEFLKSREVSLLFNMVKIVDNPMDNMALTSIIISPLFMFTPDDVASIRLVNRDASMYSSIVKISEDLEYREYSKELVTKCINFIETLNRLRNYSANCTTYDLMVKIIDITDLISIMQVYDNSNKRRENVQLFLKMAQTHDKNSITGISGFIRYINTIYDNNQDIKISKSNSSLDKVIIKTIHGSKGLEFPFVFLCDINRKFNEKDTTETIQKSFEYGLSYKLKDVNTLVEYVTADTLRMAYEKRAELRSEKMRLFYVALTRAREKLFIPLTLTAENLNSPNKPTTDYKKIVNYIDTIEYTGTISNRLIKSSIHMIDWILMVLCCSSKAQPLRTFMGVNTNLILKTNVDLNMYIYNPDDFKICEEVSSMEEEYSINETLKEDILERCNYTYNNINANLPARLSVSDIVKDDKAKLIMSNGYVSNIRFDGLKTPSFMTFKELTPAERGTAIHTVMQYCDFVKLKSSVTGEINRLKDDGYLTREQYKVMDFKIFDKFVKSDIFEYIINNPIERERSFLVKASELNIDNDILNVYKTTDTMIQGCVDLLIFEKDGITLVDYKSDNIDDENINILKDRYSLQLKLYKSAMELVENIPVKRMLIYSMKLGKSIEI